MVAIAADLPAIYVEESADDSAISIALADLSDAWPGPSLYFEPLETRYASLLNALLPEGASAEAITNAATFLELLPLQVPDPAVLVEEDGQIGLDWKVGTRALSLNLGKGGMIGYSAVFDDETAYGRAPFSSTELPARIASFLRSLATERPAGSGP